MPDGISPNELNDISKVYLDQVAAFREMRKQETEKDIERWSTPQNEPMDLTTEAVKGQDTEMRKVKAAERREKGDTRHTPKEAEREATYTKGSIDWWKNKTRKESFSDWRTELREVSDDTPETEKEFEKEVKEKKVTNKVEINPKISEAIKDIGGKVLSVKEQTIDPNSTVVDHGNAPNAGTHGKPDAKERRQSAVKRQILMKKMQALRAGAGSDVQASYEPEGEQLNELIGSTIGTVVGAKVLPGLLAKTGAKAALGKVAGQGVAKALTGKVAGGALGAAAGEVIDPFKKKKDKSPIGAAAGGAVGTAAYPAIKGATDKLLQKASYEPEGKTLEEFMKLSENPLQKAWNKFVPPPSQSANPNVRSGKLRPGKLEGPLLDKMNKGAAAVNAPIKATSQGIKAVSKVVQDPKGALVGAGKAVGKAALPVAGAVGAGLAAKAVVDKAIGHGKKKEKNNVEVEEGVGTALGAALGGAAGIGHVAGAGIAGAATAKKGRKVKKALGAGAGAAVGGAMGGPVGSIIGAGVGGKIADDHKPEGELIDERVGGAGTLVRQGIKVGGKKGGRAVQKGTTSATAAGKAQVARASQGKVGAGKFEKGGAVVGGVAGGIAGGVLDGPAPVGDIVGGIAGAKVGGVAGRQVDKFLSRRRQSQAQEDYVNDQIESAVEYFYEEGINERGIDLLIEEIGLEEFVDFVDGGAVELNEERKARKMNVRSLKATKKKAEEIKADKSDVVKKATPKDTLARARTERAFKKPQLSKPAPKAKKDFDGDGKVETPKAEHRGSRNKAITKAVAKTKVTQPKKPASKDGIRAKIKRAYEAGVKRHRKATQPARIFHKGMKAGAKATVKFAGKAKKALVGEKLDYDPMDDPDFDPREAEKKRGVSGKNNPKGGKKLKDIVKESGWHRRNPEKVGTPADPDTPVLKGSGKVKTYAQTKKENPPSDPKRGGIYKPNKEGKFVKVDEEKKSLPKIKMYRQAANLARKGDPKSMTKQTKIVSVLNRETSKGYKDAALAKLRDGGSPKHQTQEDYKKLPVAKMAKKISDKSFKSGQSGVSTKSAEQTGKMIGVLDTHDPQRSKAKSKIKESNWRDELLENDAYKTTVANLKKEFGDTGVLASKQDFEDHKKRAAAKPKSKSLNAKQIWKRDDENAVQREIDAQYGGAANRKAGHGLGT